MKPNVECRFNPESKIEMGKNQVPPMMEPLSKVGPKKFTIDN